MLQNFEGLRKNTQLLKVHLLIKYYIFENNYLLSFKSGFTFR